MKDNFSNQYLSKYLAPYEKHASVDSNNSQFKIQSFMKLYVKLVAKLNDQVHYDIS